MARPIKNNADYFPHDADMRNDPKIKAIRRKFGIEGYGVYSMLLEFLTDSEYFEFKNDKLTIELVAGDFDVEPEKLNSMLDYFKQLDLIQVDPETNILSCKSLDNRLEPLLSKRKRDRNELSTAITLKNGVIDSESTQSKVKERKVKDSIDNYPSVPERIESFKKSLAPLISEHGINRIDAFVAYWTELNSSGKKMRFEGEKYFDVGKRLGTWAKNESKFSNSNDYKKQSYVSPV